MKHCGELLIAEQHTDMNDVKKQAAGRHEIVRDTML